MVGRPRASVWQKMGLFAVVCPTSPDRCLLGNHCSCREARVSLPEFCLFYLEIRFCQAVTVGAEETMRVCLKKSFSTLSISPGCLLFPAFGYGCHFVTRSSTRCATRENSLLAHDAHAPPTQLVGTVGGVLARCFAASDGLLKKAWRARLKKWPFGHVGGALHTDKFKESERDIYTSCKLIVGLLF